MAIIPNPQTMYVCKASAGTGKTFTLAAYYISLLLRGESYRSIMAVTFTNKATAEMKDRIMNHLYLIAQGKEDSAFLKIIEKFLQDRGLSMLQGSALPKKADECFRQMLYDYDGVHVTTIDTFLQFLLEGLAYSLGQASGYTVDLDSDQAVTTAITQLLSSHITLHNGLHQTLVDYISERINEEDNWDIRTALTSLAKELFKENVQANENQIVWEKDTIAQFRKAMDWRKDSEIMQLMNLAKSLCDQDEKISYAKDFNKWKKNLLDDPKDNKTAFEVRKNAAKFNNPADPRCAELIELAQKSRVQYLTYKYTLEHLGEMMLLGYIRQQIKTNLGENNSILLAQTAYTLSEMLYSGDADFILEKAGLRYHHILLDEFQDTSTLQWKCFKPLVHELLAAGGTAFIVGDIKQGIYRWRNGDWRIMQKLQTDEELGIYYHDMDLKKNFRCHKRIIDYVNECIHTTDEAAKTEGSVRVRIYPHSSKNDSDYPSKEQAYNQILEDMFTQMEDILQNQRAKAEDCMILTRGHKDSKRVMKAFAALDEMKYPNLKKAGITSSDSLLLESSVSVQVVVNALRYCYQHDMVALQYVSLMLHRDVQKDLEWIDMRMPLSAFLEEIISLCLCKDGKFEGEDLAYLNSFRDALADYIHGNGSSVKDFLQYWEDKMHKTPISISESGSIRILTVHSSKGLESKQLFIPFCNWDIVEDDKKKNKIWCDCQLPPVNGVEAMNKIPVTFNKTLADSAYKQDYEYEREAQEQDNNNLLYVALTRAANNLFVWADVVITKEKELKEDNISHLLWLDKEIWNDICAEYDGYPTMPKGSECFIQFSKPDEWKLYIPSENSAGNTMPEPFSFVRSDGNSVGDIVAESYSENDAITFRQSQSSENAQFGTICHSVLSEMETCEDEQTAIQCAVDAGVIIGSEQQYKVKAEIDKAWSNTQMCDWFSGKYTLMREQSLLGLKNGTPEACRPDRVMICGSKAVVLDYKFGAMREKEYFTQVQDYMTRMQELGYAEVEGYIWVAEEGKLIRVEQ